MSCQTNVLPTTTDSKRKFVVWYNNQGTFAVVFVKDNLVHFSRSDGIVNKFSWICYPLDNVDIFFDWHHTVALCIIASWVEFASNLLDVSTTASNDCTDSVHVWIMTANGNFRTVTCFTSHTHDFNSSIINFWNFLLHQAFNHFWMATANKDVNTTRVVFNLVDINFDTIMRSKNFSRDLVLF